MKNALTANEFYKRQIEYAKLAFEKDNLLPRRYVLVLTNLCNLRCTFCFQERKKRPDHMTTEDWLKFIEQIPNNSRAAENSSLDKNKISKSYIEKIRGLSKIAEKRGQTISQLAISWVLQNKIITSALIGSRTVKQLNECLDSLKNLEFSKLEIKQINKFAIDEKINIWEPSSRY